ncbi:MAG: signal peptidase II [Myxococcales bacterium]|nr:signal peptidase II [Myxococcales bacterium]MCB9701584.1 signal peptidase II [Myxococcales bacterium]
MTAETLTETAAAAAAEPKRAPRLILTGVVAALVLALDLGSKAWAWENLRFLPKRVMVEGFFQLEFAFNTGSAFGFLRSASWSRIFFIAITIAAVIYMVRLALTLPARFISGYMAVALIIGGALGNLHDRFFRLLGGKHGVVDFLVFYYWPGKRWPAFNVADVALVAGVILFMIYLRRHGAALDGAARR